ncbi:MAG: polyisoprenoid-binding protein [Rhodobacteraceae bacterium]|nr:MAG: polyisoprenoid-binding protein [Paracoccaceae bacterium]
MRFSPAFALACALPLFAAPAIAAQPWVLDRSHAHITFTADHLGFSMVHGQFRTFDADILFDPENIEATELTVVIDAASVDTFWEARDRHIRSGDFLNVSTYPEITFVSREVRQTGDNTAEVVGDLTMIGQTREVVFEATLNKIGPSPFDASQTIAGFTVTGEIQRGDFGMDFGLPAFAAVIPIRIDLEISPQ